MPSTARISRSLTLCSAATGMNSSRCVQEPHKTSATPRFRNEKCHHTDPTNPRLTKLYRSFLLLIILIDFIFFIQHFIELFSFQNKQIELGDKMDLASYLLKPIQRMSKYALLLKDLIKECSQSQEQELSDLRTAEDMVKFQLRHGNDLLAMDAIRGCDVSSNQASSRTAVIV